MKMSLAAATAVLIATTVAGSAADLPVKAAPYVAPAPVSSWTGFYVGVNAGYGGGESAISTDSPLGSNVLALKSNGFLGGGQIGYNWQAGQFLYGLEADIQGTGVKSSLGLGAVAGGDAGTTVDYFGTVRGRIGFTPWDRQQRPVVFHLGRIRKSVGPLALVSNI
jgi:outer membrane immunogenic protein